MVGFWYNEPVFLVRRNVNIDDYPVGVTIFCDSKVLCANSCHPPNVKKRKKRIWLRVSTFFGTPFGAEWKYQIRGGAA